MPWRAVVCGLVAWSGATISGATSLKQMYDQAGPAAGYDRYIVLETGVIYTGGLWIGRTFNRMSATFDGVDEDVRIVGNGAIIDLQGGEICCAYQTGRLEIDDCVVLHGDIRFRGYSDGSTDLRPEGSVRYVTFFEPHDYGVRLFGCGADVLVERNLIVDTIDTGADFMYLTGVPSDWLPTGTSISLSLQAGDLLVYDNWSYHSKPADNADPQRHFTILCDYG